MLKEKRILPAVNLLLEAAAAVERMIGGGEVRQQQRLQVIRDFMCGRMLLVIVRINS